LGRWAETAPTARIEGLRAARAGGLVLVLGRPAPAVDGGERFWGVRVLVPLGFRPAPALPEPALLEVVGAVAGGLVVLTGEGAEVMPLGAFRPLTRAGVRLALAAAAPVSGGPTP
jgi:hypothetical protein